MFHSWWTRKLSLPLPCERNTVALHGGAVNPYHWWAPVRRGTQLPSDNCLSSDSVQYSLGWELDKMSPDSNRKVL